MCKDKHGQKDLVLVCNGEWARVRRCFAIWYEKIKICAKVSDERGPFLGVGPKAILFIYFEEKKTLEPFDGH